MVVNQVSRGSQSKIDEILELMNERRKYRNAKQNNQSYIPTQGIIRVKIRAGKSVWIESRCWEMKTLQSFRDLPTKLKETCGLIEEKREE